MWYVALLLVNAYTADLRFACLSLVWWERHNLVFDPGRAIFSRVSTAFEATVRVGFA